MTALGRLWRRLVRRPPDPAAVFRSRRDDLLRAWFAAAAGSGKPRGLTWVGYDTLGEPEFARDGDRMLALVPAVVRFEPIPDGELADVPQAREPRTVVAVFTFQHGRWTTDGRTVFNLTPQQLAERYRPPTVTRAK